MELLKDRFFNKVFVQELISDIKKVYPPFNAEEFQQFIFDKTWKKKELKERMHHIADALRKHLPNDYSQALGLLTSVSKNRIEANKVGFGDMILPDFVERFGIEHFEISVAALELFTQACSSEFAVRPFIIKYPVLMMEKMREWSVHPNAHVRRLSSEGCRPRLPWALALPNFKQNPHIIIPLLENLKNDESEYVRRSVANNLNDISKDHPELVISIAKKWYGPSEAVNAILKHALRTQLKKGNKEALKIFGFNSRTSATVMDLKIKPKNIKIGEHVQICFRLNVSKAEALRVEYWVHFVKANGTTSKKVFQITESTFKQGLSKEFSRKHRFQDFTTRKHYPGKHPISIVINGLEKALAYVEIKATNT